jgi:hypothetical protein
MDNKADDPKADAEKLDTAKPEHHESIIERIGDELESRFLAAAEVATATTSAETNMADAVLRAIEGPPKDESPKPETENKAK